MATKQSMTRSRVRKLRALSNDIKFWERERLRIEKRINRDKEERKRILYGNES